MTVTVLCTLGCHFRLKILLDFSREGGGVLPYMGYIGMCGPKGYGFSAVLVINKVWFLYSSLDIFNPLTCLFLWAFLRFLVITDIDRTNKIEAYKPIYRT